MARTRVRVTDVDRGYKKLVAALSEHPHGAVRVGIQGDEAAAPHAGAGEPLPNVAIGVIHEFGVPEVGIPERSFLRSTYDAKIGDYATILKKGARDVYDGKVTSERVLGRVGEKFASDVKGTINAGIDPPLQPATIARKGSSKPLIDSGQLKGSISWRYENAGDGGEPVR